MQIKSAEVLGILSRHHHCGAVSDKSDLRVEELMWFTADHSRKGWGREQETDG